jgi:hypothetical protein
LRWLTGSLTRTARCRADRRAVDEDVDLVAEGEAGADGGGAGIDGGAKAVADVGQGDLLTSLVEDRDPVIGADTWQRVPVEGRRPIVDVADGRGQAEGAAIVG